MAAARRESLIRQLVDTFINDPESPLQLVPNTEQRREIHRGVRDLVEGNGDRGLGGLYERAYNFAQNQQENIMGAITPRMIDEQEELVPFTEEQEQPPATDNYKRGGFVQPKRYRRIGSMK